MAQPPFESRVLNYIELGNEVMILACQYFMLVFASDLPNELIRSTLGLDFSILILVHLIIGFIALLIAKIISAIPKIKKAIIKIKELWLKLKEKFSKIKKQPEDLYKVDQKLE
jgi:hypothetical protein